MTDTTQAPARPMRNTFTVKSAGVEITCTGVDALKEAIDAITTSNQNVKVFADHLGSSLTELLKPYMSPEQRARGEQATQSEKYTRQALDIAVSLDPKTAGTSFETKESGRAYHDKPVMKEVPRGQVPVKTRICLRNHEVAAYDLFMECIGAKKAAAVITYMHTKDAFHKVTREELVAKNLAENTTAARAIFAQITRKCATAGKLKPMAIVFKPADEDAYVLNSRFVEYLNRRSK